MATTSPSMPRFMAELYIMPAQLLTRIGYTAHASGAPSSESVPDLGEDLDGHRITHMPQFVAELYIMPAQLLTGIGHTAHASGAPSSGSVPDLGQDLDGHHITIHAPIHG